VFSTEALRAVDLAEVWELDLATPAHETVAALHLVDDNVYAVTSKQLVFAIEARTGLLRWVHDLGATLPQAAPPAHVRLSGGGGPVVFVARKYIFVFHRYSGDLLRRLEPPFAPSGTAVADALLMYLAGTDDRLASLRWSADLRRVSLLRDEAVLEGRLISQPVLDDAGQLYFVTDTGVVHCVEGRGWERRWIYRLGGSAQGGLTVMGSTVFAASTDRHLYALSAVDGALLNRHRLPSPLVDRPAVSQGAVYQYSLDDGIFAFDAGTGERLWRQPEGRSFVARDGERLILRGIGGELLLVDQGSGGVRGSLELPKGLLLAENGESDAVYFSTPSGRVGRLGARDHSPLTIKETLEARTQLRSSPRAVGMDEDGGSALAPGREERRSDPLRHDGG
jgi:hypothetical protein